MRNRIIVLAAALAVAIPALAQEPVAYGKSEGLIPGVLIGPKVSLVALNPGVGLEAKVLGRFGLGFDYGFIPEVGVKQVKVRWSDPSLALKVYPWKRAFFVGAALGRRSFQAKVKDDAGVEASAKVESTYLAPEIGWNVVWQSGFFLSFDLGYQLVLGHTERLTIPGAMDADTAKDVRDVTRDVGKTGLPVLGLLRLGWFV
jgi:hypothetical protein